MAISYKVINGKVSDIHDHICDECDEPFVTNCEEACLDQEEYCPEHEQTNVDLDDDDDESSEGISEEEDEES